MIKRAFNPTANQAPGLKTALLTLSDNALPATQSIALSGISVAAPLTTASLSATALAFGDQQLATSSATQTVTLTNTGAAPLVIHSGAVTLGGANASQFAIANTGTCIASSGVSVAAGASCTIDVQFKPTSVVGANSATLNIVDNTPASPQIVSLTGTGTASGLAVSLTSPLANATATAPGSFTLTAAASDSSGTITRVDYYANGQLLGTATAAPYTYTWNIDSIVTAGVYSLTAVATDSNNLTATSAAVNVTVNSGAPQAYYIHTDQLDTPRAITDGNGSVVWQWDNTDPFGNNMANENPNGAGQFNFNLRFPGQYYDRETNLHYNVLRDYDPAIGRYIEFDPIGLRGGINGYIYVGGNPLSWVDPLGEDWKTWASGTATGQAIKKFWQSPATAAGELCAASFNNCQFANSPGGDAQAVEICNKYVDQMPPDIRRGSISGNFTECYSVCKEGIRKKCTGNQCPVPK